MEPWISVPKSITLTAIPRLAANYPLTQYILYNSCTLILASADDVSLCSCDLAETTFSIKEHFPSLSHSLALPPIHNCPSLGNYI